jgi:CheY-like chemotaxis protein/anti-sigma regulatory factor (Ser/Thr protein kinase)
MDTAGKKILVVEDEPRMRGMLEDFLRDIEGYTVYAAADGLEALEGVLPHHPVDLVLSDINMPNMPGFSLLAAVHERYPGIKRMLMTAYNVENYLELALTYDIGNIFVKSSPFNFDELTASLRSLLTGDIFGLARYFEPGTSSQCCTVRTGTDVRDDANRVMALLPEQVRTQRLELALVEILTNAVFYGARAESAERREQWEHDFVLPDRSAVEITAMHDNEKYGISITDHGGRLTKREILYWLNRQVCLDDNGLPLGLFDLHGRGLFIARRFIDRLILNIEHGSKTEVIILNYTDRRFDGHKPLYINEI